MVVYKFSTHISTEQNISPNRPNFYITKKYSQNKTL